MLSRSIVVLDFGAQYSQLIARRVRDENVFSVVLPCNAKIEEIKKQNPAGIILSGGPSSVYDQDAPRTDPRIFELGLPVLGICRGFQEMNVAYGGSLHPEIRELPGRLNHRAPRLPNGEFHPDVQVVFADRHDVRLTPGGVFAKLLGAESIRVNSLHGQGILEPGKRIVVEGVADDGTIEAIRVAEAPGFALGVQWHAEYEAQRNLVNRKLFEAFGAALADYQRAR